jgi:hypothetical protein
VRAAHGRPRHAAAEAPNAPERLNFAFAAAAAVEEDCMRTRRGKRPPKWFAIAVWSGIAGAAAVLAAAIGVAQS